MGRLVTNEKHRVAEWVAHQIGVPNDWCKFYAMGVERNGELVAGIVLNNYHKTNATCHIAITKPGKDVLELFRTFCYYAFVQLGLKRLTGLVPANRPKVIAFDKKLGFEEEFVIKDGDESGDLVMLVMWRDKCRWLKAS